MIIYKFLKYNYFPMQIVSYRTSMSMVVVLVVVKDECQDTYHAQHWTYKQFVISFNPVKLELASAVEWQSYQRSHHCYCAANSTTYSKVVMNQWN